MQIKIDVNESIKSLLKCADTNKDKKITIDESGDKTFQLQSCDGKSYEIIGTYYLSNLLQELIILKEKGIEVGELDSKKIFEQPVARISRMIKDYYWDGLTRILNVQGIRNLLADEKVHTKNKSVIYVPHNDKLAYEYYNAIANSSDYNFEVVKLESNLTPKYIQKLNKKPGILSLSIKNGNKNKFNVEPFVVPGGRFNEMYGWDSYFEALGLLEDGKIDLAKFMINHFIYEIDHYGKILNANRSYYLTRSQPPFFSSMLISVFEKLERNSKNIKWLKKGLKAAIKEYTSVWMAEPRLTPTGLSRYYGDGLGIPPETEPHHFDYVFDKYAKKYDMPVKKFIEKYEAGILVEPELDEFFIHDRSLRESGHDTTYRLIGKCAHLNTIDLNALLYKYECDFEYLIKEFCDDNLIYSNNVTYNSDFWKKKRMKRKNLINKLLYDNNAGMYFDYNFKQSKISKFESATSFYTLWANLANAKQARALVKNLLPELEAPGGVLSTSKKSAGRISKSRPQRQWDYPFGWAPHQIIVWQGLTNYGFLNIRERLVYKWLYTIVSNAVNYNGTIPEKYNIVERTHKVFAEYGNVGTDFNYITKEGFGWMNASFQIGKKYLSPDNISNLNNLIPPEWIFD